MAQLRIIVACVAADLLAHERRQGKLRIGAGHFQFREYKPLEVAVKFVYFPLISLIRHDIAVLVYRPRQSEAQQFVRLLQVYAFLPLLAAEAVGATAAFDGEEGFCIANAYAHRALGVIAEIALHNMDASRSEMLVRLADQELVLYFHLVWLRESASS